MEELKNKISDELYSTLIKANFNSLSSIINIKQNELAQITKLGSDSVKQIVTESANIFLNNKFRSVAQILDWHRISTGCLPINVIINGGIPNNGINEIYGCSGVGKTQLCLQLALMVQLPKYLGGFEKATVYICTEDVFPAKRFHQLAQAFKNNYKDYTTVDFESNVYIEHIADFEQLRRTLFGPLQILLKKKKVGLLVIDSIAGVFRSENLEVSYVNRSQDFLTLVTKLHEISSGHGLAVVCVNQVTDNIETGKTEPCLGLAWSNLVTSRFCINRHPGSQLREFEVIFTPDLPNKICKFQITPEGLI